MKLCSGARDDLMLVAPYIKRPILAQLLAATKSSVSVQVVTRWLPQDIRAGVTDIEVWDVVKGRSDSCLRLRQDLHAKYYRADDHCLVGSANLTGAALGLSAAPNLEVLIGVKANSVELNGFEARLLAGVVDVDDDLARLTQEAVDQLPVPNDFEEPAQIEPIETMPLATWVPSLRQPEDLFMAYQGQLDVLTSVARRCAIADLNMLCVPPGLNESTFRTIVGATLLQMPIVAAVGRFITEPRRFGEVRDLLTQLLGSAGQWPCFKV